MIDKLERPSVFAFERKLDPSDGLFYCGIWDDQSIDKKWQPIPVRTKLVRGTISNLKAKGPDPTKINAKIEAPNPQTLDLAVLPHDCDTLAVSFTLRVLGNIGCASVCNNQKYQEKLLNIVSEYSESGGIFELAKRYVYNLASARFLWRNRICSEQVSVYIELLKHGRRVQVWGFTDALALPLCGENFSPEKEKSQIETLAKTIESGLRGSSPTMLRISAFAQLGAGQEVFPSQEFTDPDSSRRKSQIGEKSRVLYSVNEIAAMHSQKIGNAIRTIDNWYASEKSNLRAIAVEPYGSVTTQGKAFRYPPTKGGQGLDFYTLLDQWVIHDKKPPLNQEHFIIAMLIRGGVFGRAEDKSSQQDE